MTTTGSADSRTRQVLRPVPWWGAGPDPPPAPTGSLDVLALANRRLGVALLVGLLAAVTICRVMAFPASIWDQDEAYLALAVVDFDPSALRPHPPWFPLWVLIGKLMAPLSCNPALGLRVVSAVAGIWLFFPLTALNAIWLRRPLATSAALLYIFLPGPWFLAGRALSDTPATFLLVLTAAWWLRRRPRPSDLVAASVAGGLCVLVRPQLAPAVLGLAAWRLVAAERAGDRWRVVGPVMLVMVVGAGSTVLASGGLGPLVGALRDHIAYHMGGLPDVTYAFTDSGLARCLIRWEMAALWVGCTAWGFAVWARRRSSVGSPLPLLVGLLAPLVLTTQMLVDLTHARYALPLLALTVGPVTIALASAFRRWTMGVLLAVVAALGGFGVIEADAQRVEPSPPMASLQAANELSRQTDGVMVVDRTLVSFADYAREAGFLSADVINDFQLEIGSVVAPPPGSVVAVYPAGRGGFVRSAGKVTVHDTGRGWLRRIGPDRFMSVMVAERSRVGGSPSAR